MNIYMCIRLLRVIKEKEVQPYKQTDEIRPSESKCPITPTPLKEIVSRGVGVGAVVYQFIQN